MLDLNQIAKVVLALIVILAVMGVIIYVIKKIKTSSCFSNKTMAIIATLFLGNKERLILVTIDGQKILLGVTAHNIQKLLLLDNAVEKASAIKEANKHNKFHDVLTTQKNQG